MFPLDKSGCRGREIAAAITRQRPPASAVSGWQAGARVRHRVRGHQSRSVARKGAAASVSGTGQGGAQAALTQTVCATVHSLPEC
ncbi:hypothetical protein NDU88_000821 [Pleurodeles waltl]|uniref:Uncharacterized protein n=1 Tax=Pleurodeles waltl TaxID=8319 RepID=A0AAV7VA04_PLEWA|nr:hypothetical protein NDU88_000821 [Pleurodeles waltl]